MSIRKKIAYKIAWIVPFYALLSLLACSDSDDSGPGTPPTQSVSEFGLDTRPINSSCSAPARPGQTTVSLSLQDAVTAPKMTGLLDMARGPAAYPSWWGIKQNGALLAVVDGASGDPQDVLLLDAQSNGFITGGELGLLGMAIEPVFTNPTFTLANNQFRIYLYYTSNTCGPSGSALCSRVARYIVSKDASGYSVGSEEALIEVYQYATNHNGGALRFGPKQNLFITFGDGGSGNDPACAGQNLGTPLGKLFRIDVNQATGYAIPVGNPYRGNTLCDRHFAGGGQGNPDLSRQGEACPEIYAYGLRNPFRISIDRDNGYLWIGDVGQNEVEEIDRLDTNAVAPNYNFGWPLREGPDSLTNNACTKLASVDNNFIPPVYYTRHSDLSSRGVMVGGVVYRGNDLGSDYFGRYFFHDAQSGEHWIMDNPYDASNQDVNGLASDAINISAYGFTQDDNGEIIYLSVAGLPQRLTATTGTVSSFPQTLAETGCFDNNQPDRPVDGVIPYSVNSPLWSDGAVKERFMSIPDGTSVTTDANGKFQFPIGSVIFKTFRTPSGALLETRMLVHHDDGDWGAYAYAWNDTGTTATLTLGETLLPQHNWTIPSRIQCLLCHTAETGRTIGTETAQLNGLFNYPQTGRLANQLATLTHIGIMSDPIDPRTAPALPSPLASGVDVSEAARAYLHVNCAHCHHPDAVNRSNMDLRYWVDLPNTSTCDIVPNPVIWGADKWSADVRLLSPGRADLSLLTILPDTIGADRMPRIGTKIIDDAAVALLRRWVNGMQACP